MSQKGDSHERAVVEDRKKDRGCLCWDGYINVLRVFEEGCNSKISTTLTLCCGAIFK